MPYLIMVRCPNADKAVSTGIHCDVKGFNTLTERPPLECPECSQIHEWSLDDAWLRDAGFDEFVSLSVHNIAPITEPKGSSPLCPAVQAAMRHRNT
jgi:hypothetical protein